MTKGDLLGQYANGWISGDPAILQPTLAPNYTFEDPNRPVAKEAMEGYIKSFEEAMGGRLPNGDLMAIDGVLTMEVGDQLIACCRWVAKGARGTGLIVVGDLGVISEQVKIFDE